uniref:Uncharacterized protein n=1 Tax=Bacillus cereus HuA4-10 TaxID=1053206 RepID=J8DRC9_BACCE|nr:hypothetical protein IGC_02749 [Bacillus cereus HuA4-10]
MEIKTKLFVSLASTILFIVAVVIFFFNDNPIKWFWVCILLGSVIQNIVLLKRHSESH